MCVCNRWWDVHQNKDNFSEMSLLRFPCKKHGVLAPKVMSAEELSAKAKSGACRGELQNVVFCVLVGKAWKHPSAPEWHVQLILRSSNFGFAKLLV